MLRKKSRFLSLVFLFTFLSITLVVNFFHTERHLGGNDDCQACRFLHSSILTAQINFFHLDPPALAGLLDGQNSFDCLSIVVASPSSRSPPAA